MTAQLRGFWKFLIIIALSSAIVECSESTKSTCEVHVKRTILPAIKKVGDYCLVGVTVAVKRPHKNENCTLVPKPSVQLIGLDKLNQNLKFADGRPAAVDDIKACLVLEDSIKYGEQTLSQVLDQQSYQNVQVKFSADNYVEKACQPIEACSSSLTVSIDQPPTVSVEVQSERKDKQFTKVNEYDRIKVCCGNCDKNSSHHLSRIAAIVTANDPDWEVVPATEELFKTNHSIQVVVKRVTGVKGTLNNQQWLLYTKYTSEKLSSSKTALQLTTKSLCEWLGKTVLQKDLSMVLSQFRVETEFAVKASVKTAVERGEFLSKSVTWRGAVIFGNEWVVPETGNSKTVIAKKQKTVQVQDKDVCADGSCGSVMKVVTSWRVEVAWSVIGVLIGAAVLGSFCIGAKAIAIRNKLTGSKSKCEDANAEGPSAALIENQEDLESNL